VKNGGQSGFEITNAEYKKQKTTLFSNPEMRKGCGPNTLDFGVRGLAITNAKHQHTTTLESRKCEWSMGPVLRGFGVRDFGVYEYPTPQTTILESQKINGVWARSFSGFGVYKLSMQNTAQRQTQNREITKKVWDPANIGFRHLVMLDA
jgi:hypothetical protein